MHFGTEYIVLNKQSNTQTDYQTGMHTHTHTHTNLPNCQVSFHLLLWRHL